MKEMRPLNIKEVLANPNNIVLIEWAEKIKDPLLRGASSIRFAHGKTENERKITTALLK